MAAKVQWKRGAWWVFTHHHGRRSVKRFGASADHRRQAERAAEKVNAALALGAFGVDRPVEKAIPCDAELRKWLVAYGPTLKHSYEAEARRTIEKNLVPHFGSRDLRLLREPDLLEYVRLKLDAGLQPKTIENQLTVLRRVLSLLVRDGRLQRSPASDLSGLMRRVAKRTNTETRKAEAWSVEEVGLLLGIAKDSQPRFYPLLATAFYTGLRRGEILALQWSDVDFSRGVIHVRRSLVHGQLTTPKSGRARDVVLAPRLAAIYFDVLAARQTEALAFGWREAPEWVFPVASETGGPMDEANLERSWRLVRRKAQRRGVRRLWFHCSRHTFASLALAAGHSVKWVADQLGHADPALTLRVYAHLIPNQSPDLRFLDFGATAPDGTIRHLHAIDALGDDNAPAVTDRGDSEITGVSDRVRTGDLQGHNLAL